MAKGLTGAVLLTPLKVWLCQAHNVVPKAVKWLRQLQSSDAECVFFLCFLCKEPPLRGKGLVIVVLIKPPAILGLHPVSGAGPWAV